MDIIEAARRAVDETPGEGRRRRLNRRVSELVRDAVLALRERGESWAQVARRLGLSVPTVRRWSERAPLKPARAMLPVEVVAEPTPELPGAGLTVVTPAGWRVEGLSLAQVRQLLGSGR